MNRPLLSGIGWRDGRHPKRISGQTPDMRFFRRNFAPEPGKDGVVMRGHNPLQKIVGIVMLSLGLLILFARVLPDGFWWFCVGAGLTVGGFLLLTRH